MKRNTWIGTIALAALMFGGSAAAHGNKGHGPFSGGYRSHQSGHHYRHEVRRHGYRHWKRHQRRHGHHYGHHYGHRYAHRYGQRYGGHYHRHGIVLSVGYGYRDSYSWCADHEGYYRPGDVHYYDY